MANKCKDCGCTCKRCIFIDHDVQLHVEIENLKERLLEKENHIITMETNFLNEADTLPTGELSSVKEELLTWQDKYKRLYEAHRRVQRVNQGLEDKLLKLVDVCETEKTALTKDVATLSQKLANANYSIKKLKEDNERYKNDVSLAIQFLQCKQSNFVAHKYDTLSPEVQSQVSNFMTTKKKIEDRRPPPEIKNIKVPIPTFPPTAMVYSVPKSPNPERRADPDSEQPSVDIVSAAIMAKVLEERQREMAALKHCDTCTCAKGLKIIHHNSSLSVGTQTEVYKEMVCFRCNDVHNVASLKVVGSNEPKTHKILPIYSLETQEPAINQSSNIVKVQPNNFLAEISTPSSPTDSNRISTKNNLIDANNHVISNEIHPYQAISVSMVGDNREQHHRLCDQSKPSYERDFVSEKGDSEKIEDPESITMSPKGPRYAAMRMQSGTRNILLDNAHNNIAPVLYTRSQETVPTRESSEMISETSAQNQQRVADWVRSNVDHEVSSSENSKSEPAGHVDRARYAEMEENVKRFLFGETEFLKTVEIGKNKYKKFVETEGKKEELQTESKI